MWTHLKKRTLKVFFFFFLIELLKIDCGFSLIAIFYLQSKNFRTIVILLVISNMVYK